MDEKSKHKIGTIAAIILIVLAIVCDLLGLIPFVKDFLGPVFWALTSLYLWKRGLGLFSAKKLATMGSSLILSLIPGIQELPIELSLGMAGIILITRLEEKTGLSASTLAQGKLSMSQGKISWKSAASGIESGSPANQNGIRQPSLLRGQPLNMNGVRSAQ